MRLAAWGHRMVPDTCPACVAGDRVGHLYFGPCIRRWRCTECGDVRDSNQNVAPCRGCGLPFISVLGVDLRARVEASP